MAFVGEIRTNTRIDGLATVLAIGTANPPNAIYQSDYPDFFFRVTNLDHMIDLKQNFKLMCEKTMIKKRYMHITEELLKENPCMCDNDSPSLNARQAIQATAITDLGIEAATKAIEEWGQPKSKITHLIFCTTSPIDIPGPDYHLTRLLGLNPSVKRYMFPSQGCYAGASALRLAKDLAENNLAARVLVVCSENTVMYFQAPTETNHTAQAFFSDGAGAVIVGANQGEDSLSSSNERPIFELVSTAQTIFPDSHGAIELPLREDGVTILTNVSLSKLISDNIEKALVEAFEPLGIDDWNSIFWISHPGNPFILKKVESKLGLEERKFDTVRHVLSEFGNMLSASVLFVMDEMRKRSSKEGKPTTGDGLQWGVLFGFGPGFTAETIVLRSFPL